MTYAHLLIAVTETANLSKTLAFLQLYRSQLRSVPQKPDTLSLQRYRIRSDSLMASMEIRNSETFHKNEWKKHGVCQLKLLLLNNRSKYDENGLFLNYFQTSVKLTKQHSAVNKFEFNSKEQLAQELNIDDPDTFYISCRKKTEVKDINLCLAIAEPRNEEPIYCFNKYLNKEARQCSFPVKWYKKGNNLFKTTKSEAVSQTDRMNQQISNMSTLTD